MYPLMAAVLSRVDEAVELLVKNKHLDINCKDPDTGITSLWLAAYIGEGHMIKLLAENGADIYATNDQGVNILHLAASMGHTEVFKMLLDSCYDPLRETQDGMTAFHIACIENKEDIVTCYLDYLSRNEFKRKYQQTLLNHVNPKMQLTPLGFAILMGNNTIASDLISSGALYYLEKNDILKDLSPIFMAIDQNSVDLIEQMMDNGLDLGIHNSMHESPLLYAI